MSILEKFQSGYGFYIYYGKNLDKELSEKVFAKLVDGKDLTFYSLKDVKKLSKGKPKFSYENNLLFSLFSYSSYPMFIEKKTAQDYRIKEKRYGYVMIIINKNYLFIKKSAGLNAINEDALDELELRKLNQKEKKNLLSIYKNLTKVNVRNTKPYGYSTQSISVDYGTLTSITPVQQMVSYYTKSVKVQGSGSNNDESLLIHNGTSRCSYASKEERGTIQDLKKFCENTTKLLQRKNSDKSKMVNFFNFFAKPVEDIKDLKRFNGGFFYFDLTKLRDLLEKKEEKEYDIDEVLKKYSAYYSLSLKKKCIYIIPISDKEGEENSQNEPVGYLTLNKKKLKLNLGQNIGDPKYNSDIEKGHLFFAYGTNNIIYSESRFYQGRNFENCYNVESLIDIFKGKVGVKVCGEKEYLREDGKREFGKKDRFHEDSVFGWIEKYFREDKKKKSEWLILDDMGKEISDYIVLSDDYIHLIHAKSNNKKNSNSMSVSNFHVVVGQALKNIGDLDNMDNIKNKLTPKFLEGTVKMKNGESYPRKRIGEGNINDFKCWKNLNIKKKIILAVDFFTINGITNFLEGEDSHAKRQMTNLLLELVLSAKSRGIDVEIRCKKDN